MLTLSILYWECLRPGSQKFSAMYVVPVRSNQCLSQVFLQSILGYLQIIYGLLCFLRQNQTRHALWSQFQIYFMQHSTKKALSKVFLRSLLPMFYHALLSACLLSFFSVLPFFLPLWYIDKPSQSNSQQKTFLHICLVFACFGWHVITFGLEHSDFFPLSNSIR